MRILLSNDDGIEASGINALREMLESMEYTVYVAAPDRERSAAGHGITVHRPLRVKEHIYGAHSRGWAIDGTPADCVKIAVDALLPERPDLVVSGINIGPNLGTDVLYSGTVSAAFEGVINGVPSLAVSLATYEDPDFTYTLQFLRGFLPAYRSLELPPGTILNINVPPGVPQGTRMTRQGTRRYINVFDRRIDPRGHAYYWLAGEPEDPDDNDETTDTGAVKNHFIAISPLQIDLTRHDLVSGLKSLEQLRFKPGAGKSVLSGSDPSG